MLFLFQNNIKNEPVVIIKRGIETLKNVIFEIKDETHKTLSRFHTIFLSWKIYLLYIVYILQEDENLDIIPLFWNLICASDENNEQNFADVLHTLTRSTFQEFFLWHWKDEYYETILQRISCLDWKTAKARYHNTCYRNLMEKYFGTISDV